MLAEEELTVTKFELVAPFHSEIINIQSIVKRGLQYSLYQTCNKEKVFVPSEVSICSSPSGTEGANSSRHSESLP